MAQKSYNVHMPGRVYIETTVVSYLTARPSRDIVRQAHQQITREWWDNQRRDFELYASQAVIVEARAGDPNAAAARLDALRDVQLLEATEEAALLAQRLMDEVPLPERAAVDAAHIAVAAVHGLDYLLTWNCRHIANAVMRPDIEEICREAGFEPPVICTPEELLRH